MPRSAFIVGGTGQIGRAVTSNLLAGGWAVSVASRGFRSPPENLAPFGARFVPLDREGPGELARALSIGTDALIDLTAYSPAEGRQLLDLQGNVGALVVVSSSSVYRDDKGRTLDEATQNGFPELPDPIAETQPTVAPGDATYSTRKVALEHLLLDKATIPVTILRPAAIHGPGSIHPREWWFVKRILDGRQAIPLAYEGRSRFHTSSVLNIAELVRVVLDQPSTRILNIADPAALSVAEIGSAIARHMSYAGKFLPVVSDAFPASIGRTPWSVPRPFVLDNGAALALGYAPTTTYPEAVAAICNELANVNANEDWQARFPILASYAYDLFDYSGEDAFLSDCERASR
ncbi:MAG TPA: NAD-dependent epimerase/dehydratase family protein [Sphingobium sp.]|uniref:NAD-dependent epimerase/dehydratase family protein n=1 Tax=Sphingobium sp. TaxID=1912891 RepID=UPI002ED2F265